MSTADPVPADIDALHVALVAAEAARREAEARASGAEAMVGHLKSLRSVGIYVGAIGQDKSDGSADRAP
jgi:hypothetical protein